MDFRRPRYRLVAVDIDGTLMDSANRLPEANRDALYRAHEAGIKVCLCTGRSLTEAQPVLDALGLDLDAAAFIFGAMVSDLRRGRTLARRPLEAVLADRLIDFFTGWDYPVLCVYDRTERGFDYHLIEGTRHRHPYEDWVLRTPCRVERCARWLSDGVQPLRVGVILESDAQSELLVALKGAFPAGTMKFNVIYVAQYGFHVLECFAPDVNKWYGIDRLCHLWQIDSAQIAAIGDDVNDIEMLQHAGLGVAVGNAPEAVKKVADAIAPTNDACGVAWLIDRLLATEPAFRRLPEE